MGGRFNERAFLLRALVGVFILQFAAVGYQYYFCQAAIKNVKKDDRVALVCQSASTNFNETGKVALATFLALLVPAQKVSSSKREDDDESEG